MNRTVGMKYRRLIEALDYIDDEYIASAALYKMRAYAESARPPAQTAGQSIKKYWRQFAALAACLILLAFASPVLYKVVEVISSFAAGWGSESTTEEVSETPITDENGIPYTYPMFVEDLEYLSVEEMKKILDVFYDWRYDRLYNTTYSYYLERMDEDEDTAKKKAHEEALKLCGDKHCFFNEKRYTFYHYYGKFGDCVALGNLTYYMESYTMDDFMQLLSHFSADLYIYKDGKMYSLKTAYESGFLSYEQMELLLNRIKAYTVYRDEQLFGLNDYITENNTEDKNDEE